MADTPKAATHKALTFADRLKTVTKKIDADLDAGVAKLEELEAHAADANNKIASIVSQKHADVSALMDALNQLTNGAPDEEPAPGTPMPDSPPA